VASVSRTKNLRTILKADEKLQDSATVNLPVATSCNSATANSASEPTLSSGLRVRLASLFLVSLRLSGVQVRLELNLGQACGPQLPIQCSQL